jgi:transcriptional regulator with XRE-family HTH domain
MVRLPQVFLTNPAVYTENGRYKPLKMNRIKELREGKGWTQEQLAEFCGTSGATIQRLERGRRKLTDKWIPLLSNALGVQPGELFVEIIEAVKIGLPVKGEAQAGVWREADIIHEPIRATLNIGPDARYEGKDQFAVLVQGNSMNKKFTHGQYIVCVRWDELGREPRNGDIVVVERRDGGRIETTVKRVSLARNRPIMLAAESDDPKWKDPIPLLPENEAETVTITALVVGRYEQL